MRGAEYGGGKVGGRGQERTAAFPSPVGSVPGTRHTDGLGGVVRMGKTPTPWLQSSDP